jgi:hypothetical protein
VNVQDPTISKLNRFTEVDVSSAYNDNDGYYNVNRNNRNCKFCIDDMEDEMHFILLCPMYTNLRCNLIKPYYWCLIITRCSLHKDCCSCHKLFKPIRHNSLRTQHTQLFVSFGFFCMI